MKTIKNYAESLHVVNDRVDCASRIKVDENATRRQIPHKLGQMPATKKFFLIHIKEKAGSQQEK